MKNCIPLLGVLLCLTLLHNCTNRDEENNVKSQTNLKTEKFTTKANNGTVVLTPTNGDPDPEPDPPVRDGDDWLIKP